MVAVVVVDPVATHTPGASEVSFAEAISTTAEPLVESPDAADLAFVIYTSGSTGVPKGVMLTHGNAISFLDWCTSVFQPTEEDRFSSHAPFHFDPSILDLYLTIKHGASVYLIPHTLGKNPDALSRFIQEHRLTIWTSTPSILARLVQFGDLNGHDASSLRLVLFGGEVFPTKYLRHLRRLWPSPIYYNLYGPTETTNTCTFARIPDVIADDRQAPYPIGFPCAHCRSLVIDDDGGEVGPGQEGLLHISGPSVFAGYWGKPAETAAAFVERDGVRWYNTGDIVRLDPAEGFSYVGRKDRMVKRRGFRIELGEIELALHSYPRVQEAAVVSVLNDGEDLKIVAFLAFPDALPPSLIDLKAFCAANLPNYMSPDRFVFQEGLPRTSTDKVDYQALMGQVSTVNFG